MNKKNYKEASFFINDLAKGGAEKVVSILTNYLNDKKINIDLILINKKISYKLDKKVNVIVLDDLNNNNIFSIFFNKRLKKLFNKKKIIISHLLKSNYINIISSLFFSSHKPIIVIHNHPMMHFYDNYIIGFFKSLFHYLFQIVIFRFALKIIVVSNEIKIFYKKFLFLNTELIYNPLIENSKQHNLKELNQSKKYKKNILVIGSLISIKNHLELLKCISLMKKNNENILNKIKFLIIGDGPFRKKLESFVLKNSLNKFVSFIGEVENLFPYYSSSFFSLSVSKSEAMSNVLVESLSFNKPVIASNCTGTFELLSDKIDLNNTNTNLYNNYYMAEYGIIYQNGNLKQLAEAITFLVSDKNYYNTFVNNIKNSNPRFNITNSNKYIEILNKYI